MKILLQIAFLFSLCLICDALAAILPFTMPGSVLAMILLFLFLSFRIIKFSSIKETAVFLQKNIAFFFIPSGVALIDYFSILAEVIFPVIIISITSVFLTFAATGWTVQFFIKLQERFRDH